MCVWVASSHASRGHVSYVGNPRRGTPVLSGVQRFVLPPNTLLDRLRVHAGVRADAEVELEHAVADVGRVDVEDVAVVVHEREERDAVVVHERCCRA